MSYIFTPTQQIEIIDAYASGPQNEGDSGNFAIFYSRVAEILTTEVNGVTPDELPNVLKPRIWVEGALNVNINQGAFARMIREYAKKEGNLHYAETFTDAQLQEASNAVARLFYDTLKNDFLWTLPNIDVIADKDLLGVSQVLFDRAPQDSVFQNNTAWPGTLLLSKLRDQADFTQNLITVGPNPEAADNLDDWRNVLYANHSFGYGFTEAMMGGGYDFININDFVIFDNINTLWELYWLKGGEGELDGRVPLTVSAAVEGLKAEAAFAPVINFGDVGVLHMLEGASSGQFSNPIITTGINDYFNQKVLTFFGGPGTQNQSIATTVHLVDNLVTDALDGDMLAQKALQGLSIFKVDNGVSININVSKKYWIDRGAMTKARLAYDAKFNLFGLTQNAGTPVSSADITQSTRFKDLNVNVNFVIVNPPANSPTNLVEIIFGNANDNSLIGGVRDDSLYGADGADTLNGGGGNDFLSGGNGNDNYIVNDGRDVIFDSDGMGSIKFNGEILTGGDRVGGNVWDSDDGRFRYNLLSTFHGNHLIIKDSDEADSMVVIEGFSTVNNMGIVLNNSSDPLPPTDTFAPSDTAAVGTLDYYETGSTGNDFYDAGNLYDTVTDFQGGHDVVLLGSGGGLSDRASTAFGNDVIYGEEGNDVIYGEEGKDFILAGVGFNNAVNGPIDKDTVIGGADIDLIDTGVGDDFIIAGEEGEDINATNTSDQGDWIVADEGNDVAYGTGNQDFITMGTGADLVYAGGGFDIILADGYYTFERNLVVITPVPFIGRLHNWDGSNWNTSSINYALVTPGDAFNFTTSITAGGDFEFIPEVVRSTTDRVQDEVSDSNNDIVYAGPGSDWISGGPGSDTLYGEADDDMIYGDDLVAMPVGSEYGNDLLFGGSGDDMLFGNQGHDTLDGGSGDDMLFGDDLGEPSGNDFLYGGDGVDEIYGYGGDDYISGGTGDDVVLVGGDGDDVIDGNDGNDILNGEAGLDNLRGGQGDDILNGGDDNDFLFGGAGDDILNGDDGNDVLNGGVGIDMLNGGSGDDVYLAVLNNSSATSPDTISDSGGLDRIKFDEFVYPNRITFEDVGGDMLVHYSPNDALKVSGGAGGSVIEEFEFIDGRVLSYVDLTTVLKTPMTSTMLMASSNQITAFNDWYEGDATIQNLDMLDGDDAVIARGGNDIVFGGAGKDVLDGGADNDTLHGGIGNDRLFGASGNDTLNGDDGDDLLAGGDGVDTLNGGAGIDVLRGGKGDDNLQGGDGNDLLQGDRGADTLTGGLGHDTYIFRYQDDPEPGVMPFTTIVDTNDSGGNTIRFLGGLDADDVTLVNSLVTGDLEIQYGHHENTILSSIHIANSAQGEVISQFSFSDGTMMGFSELCALQPATCEMLAEEIFTNGFEQVVLKTATSYEVEILQKPESSVVDNLESSPLSSISLLAGLILQGVLKQ